MDKFYLISFYMIKFIVKTLPNFALDGFANLLGSTAFYLDKKHKNIIMTNLDLCYKDSITKEQKTKITKDTYKHFAKFGIDFIKNQNTTKKRVLQKVTFKNKEIITQAIKTGRPIIVQTAHFGNWELFSLAMAAKFNKKTSIVGRDLDSPAMNSILSKNRTQFGIELIEKSNAARKILRAFKNDRIVGILTDQNTAKSEGIEVSFFGKRALHTPAVSIFAQKSGALIVPGFIYKNDKNEDEVYFFTPIDMKKFPKDEAIQRATQLQADATEKIIRRYPSQYFWFHKRFKHFYEDRYE